MLYHCLCESQLKTAALYDRDWHFYHNTMWPSTAHANGQLDHHYSIQTLVSDVVVVLLWYYCGNGAKICAITMVVGSELRYFCINGDNILGSIAIIGTNVSKTKNILINIHTAWTLSI